MSETNTHARYHAIVADLRDLMRRASDLLADLDTEAARAAITTTSPELLLARRAVHHLYMLETKSRVYELESDEVIEFGRLLLTPEGRRVTPMKLLADRFGLELPKSVVYRWVEWFYAACRRIEETDAKAPAQRVLAEPVIVTVGDPGDSLGVPLGWGHDPLPGTTKPLPPPGQPGRRITTRQRVDRSIRAPI